MEEVKVSERFNSKDADIILISSDKIQFKVHKINLITASTVFKDMFDIGKAEEAIPKIDLQESAGVLEIVLPYVYPNSEPKVFELRSHFSVVAMRTVNKYLINYGIQAVELALNRRELSSHYINPYFEVFFGYSFASLSNNYFLHKRYFNRFMDLAPKFGRLANVSPLATKILQYDEMVQLDQEWTGRIFEVTGLYHDLTAKFITFQKEEAHNKNDKLIEPLCDTNIYCLVWCSLAGIASSKKISEIVTQAETGECCFCRNKLGSLIGILTNEVRRMENRSL